MVRPAEGCVADTDHIVARLGYDLCLEIVRLLGIFVEELGLSRR